MDRDICVEWTEGGEGVSEGGRGRSGVLEELMVRSGEWRDVM